MKKSDVKCLLNVDGYEIMKMIKLLKRLKLVLSWMIFVKIHNYRFGKFGVIAARCYFVAMRCFELKRH